jgi:glycosyltransferase involved in cell wall biosynthesis
MTTAVGVHHGRVGLQQRVAPGYRAAFFDRLAGSCPDGLSVFAGEPRPDEAIVSASAFEVAKWERARNVHLFTQRLYLCWQPGLRTWLERWDPQILILEANLRYPSNWGAAAWMRERRRPVIGWGLGVPGATGLAALPWRRFLRRLDGAIAYSQRGARQYAAAGFPADRIWVAPNAVAGPPGPLRQREARRAGSSKLIFVGRLQARKRVDALLEASSRLYPAPEVWIVGEGPARAELEAQASGLRVPARFFGDLRGRALDERLDAADVFVLPGTGGLAVQQAMARGLPVIVAEGDGTQEDLVTKDNGWLVPPGDVGALVETLRIALALPDRLLDMGLASHRLAVERFNLDVMVRVFLTAMQAVRKGT